MKTLLFAGAMALATITANAGGFTGGSKGAATYKLDPAASKITWTAKKVTGSHTGDVKFATGSLAADDKGLKSGNFTVDMKTITCTDISDAETNGKLLGHLNSPDFFDTEKSPASTFVITKVQKVKGNTYNVVGDLTIKGIKSSVSFPADVKMSGKNATATGKLTIDRTKYDIKYGSGKFFEGLGDKMINDDFVLDLILVANK